MFATPRSPRRPSRTHPSDAAAAPALLRSTTTTRRSLLGLAGIGAAGLALSACGGTSGSSGKPVVITGCYGLTYAAQQVAGDLAEVVSLAQPGVDPHDLELSVAQVAQVQEAALIVQIPGFQASLDDAISSKDLSDATLDVSTVVTMLSGSGEEDEHDHGDEESEEGASDEGGHEGHDHGALDPHFWNDPVRLGKVAEAIGEHLAKADPDNASTFRENGASARSALEDLDAELKKEFDAVKGDKPFVTSHTAFAYLADRYGLEQIGITGIDPEVEPSPKRLLQLQKVIKDQHVTTVFFETTASPKVAETLADNVGAKAEELDNLETQLSEDADYPAVMRENCTKLVASWS
ncbi:zinc ABC transporter substrate-binding protein [Brachybacterium halotolerans subsp. kimchii]|uniref:metal ABC transporter substrate-binding protein n=1 Tax=Brachybacterium halotolerans TaxID=2795215 RepID=UPI001E4FC525|nr:metal ABC transporter substrate-binding protein [Brachybacterium halotolerans]UEJ83092.1 zinc ABC transporter substrate-binding protein [Brachybacterium halotolerans subsp. kimchii]